MESEVEQRRAESLALDAILEATRALLWISTPADARVIAGDVVGSLGGEVVPAGTADGDALPIDVSFGDGEPLVPRAPRSSVARLLMERHLPSLVEDIRRAVELGSLTHRLAEDASIDSLTGLPNRRMLGRAIGRLARGDVVIMVDLDHFKAVNDDLGHAVGDRVLQAVGLALRSTVRERDAVGRYGGEEFMVILRDGADPEAFLERLRSTWVQVRPRPVTFSAGLARVVDETTDAVEGADRALYQAKREGRDRWAWAPGEGHTGEVTSRVAPAPDALPAPAFVAFSELVIPEGRQDLLDGAFRDRLGAVEGHRGFRALEVWADLGDPTAYSMVSWWESREEFQAYMRSDDHRRSHERIPTGDERPRPRRFRRFRVVSR